MSVISRGYRRAGKGVKIVSDGNRPGFDWTETGDEPYLLAQKLPGISVLVGEDRYAAGEEALRLFHPDFLILDDGFQHVRLHRDIDIIVIDASNPFGNGRIFPAGPLREPLASLKRADLFWLTRVDQSDDLSKVERIVQHIGPDTPVIHSLYRPAGLRDIRTGAESDMAILKEARTVLISGIANPHSFEKTVQGLGAYVVEHHCFPDHHPFTQDDMERIMASAMARKAAVIVTTEKDGVRIPKNLTFDIPLCALKIEMIIVRGKDTIEKWLWTGMPTKHSRATN